MDIDVAFEKARLRVVDVLFNDNSNSDSRPIKSECIRVVSEYMNATADPLEAFLEIVYAFDDRCHQLGWLMHCCQSDPSCIMSNAESCARVAEQLFAEGSRCHNHQRFTMFARALDVCLYLEIYVGRRLDNKEPGVVFLQSTACLQQGSENSSATKSSASGASDFQRVMDACAWDEVYAEIMRNEDECYYRPAKKMCTYVVKRVAANLRDNPNALQHWSQCNLAMPQAAFGTDAHMNAMLRRICEYPSVILQVSLLHLWTSSHGSSSFTRHPWTYVVVPCDPIARDMHKIPCCIFCPELQRRMLYSSYEFMKVMALELKRRVAKWRGIVLTGYAVDFDGFKRFMCTKDKLRLSPGANFFVQPLHVRERIQRVSEVLSDFQIPEDKALLVQHTYILDKKQNPDMIMDVIDKSRHTSGMPQWCSSESFVMRVTNLRIKGSAMDMYDKRVELMWGSCRLLNAWGVELSADNIAALEKDVEMITRPEWQQACDDKSEPTELWLGMGIR